MPELISDALSNTWSSPQGEQNSWKLGLNETLSLLS